MGNVYQCDKHRLLLTMQTMTSNFPCYLCTIQSRRHRLTFEYFCWVIPPHLIQRCTEFGLGNYPSHGLSLRVAIYSDLNSPSEKQTQQAAPYTLFCWQSFASISSAALVLPEQQTIRKLALYYRCPSCLALAMASPADAITPRIMATPHHTNGRIITSPSLALTFTLPSFV